MHPIPATFTLNTRIFFPEEKHSSYSHSDSSYSIDPVSPQDEDIIRKITADIQNGIQSDIEAAKDSHPDTIHTIDMTLTLICEKMVIRQHTLLLSSLEYKISSIAREFIEGTWKSHS